MDKEIKDVNWSALATNAFVRRLNGEIGIELDAEIRDLRARLDRLEAMVKAANENAQ